MRGAARPAGVPWIHMGDRRGFGPRRELPCQRRSRCSRLTRAQRPSALCSLDAGRGPPGALQIPRRLGALGCQLFLSSGMFVSPLPGLCCLLLGSVGSFRSTCQCHRMPDCPPVSKTKLGRMVCRRRSRPTGHGSASAWRLGHWQASQSQPRSGAAEGRPALDRGDSDGAGGSGLRLPSGAPYY